MIDSSLYTQILNCAYEILKDNGGKLGREFCEGFMFDHDPNNGRSVENNVINLYNHVTNEGPRRFGGNTLTTGQLWEIVGDYIEHIYRRWSSRNRGGSSFSRGSNAGGNLFSRGGGDLFGNNRSSFASRANGPGSYLTEDKEQPVLGKTSLFDTPVSTPEQTRQSPTVVVKEEVDDYPDHPLDDFPETSSNFRPVETGDCWDKKNPPNRTITIMNAYDYKTDDPKYTIRHAEAFMHRAVDNEIEVVQEFLKIAPATVLGRLYQFKIHYNHITTIPISTDIFTDLHVTIRNMNAMNVIENRNEPFYKVIKKAVGTLSRDAWVAMSEYLVGHINRALYISGRLTEKPEAVLRIDSIDDLDDLFDPGLNTRHTNHPDKREAIYNLVSIAIRNALADNTWVLFKTIEFPTDIMRNSLVFPFAMRGVYYNKDYIPNYGDPCYESFLAAVDEHMLHDKTYILSKRAITVTNILGKDILSSIEDKPKLFRNKATGLINHGCIEYLKRGLDTDGMGMDCDKRDDPEVALEKLKRVWNNKDEYDQDMEIPYKVSDRRYLPVDHTLFATKFGEDPESYLKVIDVFNTIDQRNYNTDIILASKKLKTLNFV